jgi:hypothetical protein
MHIKKIGHRVVVISGTATPPKKVQRRTVVQGQRVGAHRVVIIKDGQVVHNKPNH